MAQDGYVVLRGNRLKEVKITVRTHGANEIDFGTLERTPRLGIFFSQCTSDSASH